MTELVEQLKEMERQGYVFEGAEASFELLLRKAVGEYAPYFSPVGFELKSNKATRSSPSPNVEASVEIEVGDAKRSLRALETAPSTRSTTPCATHWPTHTLW